MWSIAQDTAPQIVLRNCSKEVVCMGDGVSVHLILVKGVCAVRHMFWQKVAASQQEHMSPLMISVLF